MSKDKNTGGENKNNQTHGTEKNLHPTKSGAIYFLKVDGVVLKSDTAMLRASDVLAMAGLNSHSHELVSVFKDDCKETLSDDALIDLNNYGVEEFVTEKRLVEVFYKTQAFKVHPGNFLVSEIKKILGLPQACHLSVLAHDDLKPLDDNGTFCIQGGEHFVSHSCDGNAS